MSANRQTCHLNLFHETTWLFVDQRRAYFSLLNLLETVQRYLKEEADRIDYWVHRRAGPGIQRVIQLESPVISGEEPLLA